MRATMSIWFFAGVMLLAYGIVILAAGLWELGHPLAHPPVSFPTARSYMVGSSACHIRWLLHRKVLAATLAFGPLRQALPLSATEKKRSVTYAKTVNACIDCWKPWFLSRSPRQGR